MRTTEVSEPWVLSYFSQVSEKLGKTQNSKPTSPTPTNFIKRKSDYKLCIHYSITTLHKAQQKGSCLISQAMLINQLLLWTTIKTTECRTSSLTIGKLLCSSFTEASDSSKENLLPIHLYYALNSTCALLCMMPANKRLASTTLS